ncbi:hypothetical protein ACFSKN_02495 [Mariniflexile gromovii]|uniref:Glucosamine inositolphosphorylceramide transferase 1 N-terminal domain-containing protein n=1 Tax=Mariniflexile gromovii TaxID=362523 RepID=A0ABS4BPX8_9FLAO|nr:hypothetical protein [Mariniflexile gromovii]MBP0902473.1 hypothetical protein [Mariniflexile gromovii]
MLRFIGRRFTNFKTSPFNKIDLNKASKELKNLRILNSKKDLELYDWIILEKKANIQNNFSKHTKKGFLTINVSFDEVLFSVMNYSHINLDLLIYNSEISKDWIKISKTELSIENGMFNNIFKLLFSYSIYLRKFIKNYEDDIIARKNLKILNNREVKFKKIKLYFNYINLCFILLRRKLDVKQKNWKLAVSNKNKPEILLNQPKDSFWADPFIIKHDNYSVIYFEELKEDGLGKISCVTLDENFDILEKKTIIDENYHLSFPNVFFINDNYYMIPESSQKKTLEIYKCKNFPFEWMPYMELMNNIKLLDAIWLFHDGLYWIFANKVEDFEHDNNERLYLYYSKNLFSKDWEPHVKNPIVTNLETSRNAGDFLQKNGKIFRISQNCKNGYGNNLVVNKITELTTLNYSEEKVEEIFPPNGYEGMHTMNTDKGVSVFDYLKAE